jgi:hypothetical protein
VNQTEICNLALQRVGILQPIANINESSNQARACKAAYTPSLQLMLRERNWPFAQRTVSLALVGENLHPEWFYTYRYPSNYVVIQKVLPASEVSTTTVNVLTSDRPALPDTYPYMIGSDASGRLLHTDVEDAVVIGAYLNTDTAQFDPMFANALSWRLAHEISLPLSKNREIRNDCFAQYMSAVSEAFATSLNEPEPRSKADATSIQARE